MPALSGILVFRRYSSIAQSVEHAAVNRRVVGSSPTWGAIDEMLSEIWRHFVFLLFYDIIGVMFMEFIFELILEIIMQPIVEVYAFAMMLFTDKNKRVNKRSVKAFVFFECIVLLLLFIVGGVIVLETGGSSVLGKAMFLTSITVSVVQIILGIILRKFTKEKE